MTKTQIAILWGLAVLVVAVFVVLGQVLSRPAAQDMQITPPPGKTYSLPQVAYSARGFYARALQAASSWQSDAQLVSAAAHWSFARLDHLSQPTTWTFQFFSPGTQRIYVAGVDEQTVTFIRSSLTPYPLATMTADRWQIDSPEALNTWLNYGGGRFLELNPAVDVSARLVAGSGDSIEWVVVGSVSGVPDVQVSHIDAATGNVTE